MVKTLACTLIFLFIYAFFAGCSSKDVAANATPEERFAHAKALFEGRDFLEAMNEFTVITLQYQGSGVAADAQFYLGECRFAREEYLLAAFEYGVLKRNYPASPRVPDGQLKLAMSYYELSPRPALDQQYTKKAIDEFQSFVEYYPANQKAVEADAKIRELLTRLAKKQYETARLYTTMDYFKAAIASFDVVIEKYHDTEYAPLAYLDKAELLMSRRKYREASAEVENFLSRYPNSVLRGRGDSLKAAIEKVLHSGGETEARDSAGIERADQRVTPPTGAGGEK